jgi:hypothetical protein
MTGQIGDYPASGHPEKLIRLVNIGKSEFWGRFKDL